MWFRMVEEIIEALRETIASLEDSIHVGMEHVYTIHCLKANIVIIVYQVRN